MKKQDVAKKMSSGKQFFKDWKNQVEKETPLRGSSQVKSLDRHVKKTWSGKASLNIPKGEKNEGEKMMFGKNNSQRA